MLEAALHLGETLRERDEDRFELIETVIREGEGLEAGFEFRCQADAGAPGLHRFHGILERAQAIAEKRPGAGQLIELRIDAALHAAKQVEQFVNVGNIRIVVGPV